MEPQAWQLWLAALITLGIYSYLYNDNKFYRVLLNAMIGLGVGYYLIVTWKQVVGPLWWDPMNKGFSALTTGEPEKYLSLWILVGLLGTLWYFQFSRKYLWLSRVVIGMTLGMGAGIVFKGQFLLNMPQITDSFRPLITRAPNDLYSNGMPLTVGVGDISIVQSLNNVIYVVTIICVMVYFFFSFSHDKPVTKRAANLGRWMLMISFGAFFGNTIMTRMSVFLQRVKFLTEDWGPRYIQIFGYFVQSYLYAFLVVILAITAIYLIMSRHPSEPPGEESLEGNTDVSPEGAAG